MNNVMGERNASLRRLGNHTRIQMHGCSCGYLAINRSICGFIMLRMCKCKSEQFIAIAQRNRLVCLPCNGCLGGYLFQAADIATIAAFTVPINRDVPQLACCAGRSIQDSTVTDYPTANASTDCKIDEISTILTCAKHVFSQSSSVGVILKKNGNRKFCAEKVTQRNIIPTRQVGRIKYYPCMCIKGARSSNANTSNLIKRDLCFRKSLSYSLEHAWNDTIRCRIFAR